VLRGFYNAAQAMLVKQRELDAISNNLSNVNTAGYRKDEVVVNTFQEELILVRGRTRTSGTFLQSYADQTKANLEQGGFEATGSNFDLAIYGNVYFNIRQPNGDVKQTRNGQFALDEEGYLTLGQAGRVQGANGDILVGSDNFTVEEDGGIYNADHELIDNLLFTYIPEDADVAKTGENLFTSEAGVNLPDGLPEGETFAVMQGVFEKSNVDSTKEMTQAMEVQRLYEANSKLLTYFDTMNAKSSNIATLSKA
jgi:flagellar basal body rod protein FlgG